MSNGRVFGASLKPAWSADKIKAFLEATQGDILVYIINHDKDYNDLGELVEPHTHIYLEYETPRKLSTIANLLKVEANFIEIIRNKKGYLRYLTHKDDLDKFQYDNSEVLTNSSVSYDLRLLGASLSDKEIAEYILEGRGLDLLGIVPAGRLRTIQSLLHFDTSNTTLNQVRMLNDKLDKVVDFIDYLDLTIKDLLVNVKKGGVALVESLKSISKEISAFRSTAMIKRH
jgi:hypothetical protein